MNRATRCLLLLILASCFLFFALVPRYELLEESPERVLVPRQQLGPLGPSDPTGSSAPPSPSSSPSSPSSSPPPQPPPQSSSPPAPPPQSSSPAAPPPQSSSPSAPPSSSAPPTSAALPSTSPPSSSTPPPSTPPSNTTPPPSTLAASTPVLSSSPLVTTNSAGDLETTVIIATLSTANAATTPSQTDSNDDNSGSGLGTGSIIGLSVAGGVALIGIVGFFVWKFTRKRFGSFDDNEAIKWPELNAHGDGTTHALPVNATGGAGFGNESEVSLSREPSTGTGGYAPSAATTSTPELYQSGADPYAVPPLPHLNPNQPYRDDPTATAYYDPYNGPVPNTFNDAASVDTHGGYGSGEAIPMTQLAPGRSRSPGPQAAYDMVGRASPQPSMAGRRSPGPQAAMGYDPRGVSPVPLYGDPRGGTPAPPYDRARSPGPGVGLGVPAAGRRSPGPQAGYDAYGPR